ncbi:Holliday junction branch migration protein RuvA [Fructilactobacillus cliffordii]|uniref:Holliday junction branch migration complex subunit RuvA n=1 Tax=Fructilactobacillus cliffordii TaxID=2940299 RepID=A0A9Q8ZYD3_9LACO|nr:Holliday junction branch migration protein RuvA [Fructilactobacillus cliffordii]USS86810.1 Holliday junction branch migration protein RuvA [Fructilactobacillus cliffordii]USS89806.1 Holliday junction branch migration protein RuvA [Fructilactobacillus cliffordii]
MFEYLNGIVTSVTPQTIVIDVNGVGYLVYVANPYHFERSDQVPQKIYVHQNVTDSSQTLYGFATAADKQLFEQLLNVSGIGAKSALAIMAGNDNQGLITAIQTEDVQFLTKFPGIGKKTARQIILDLQDKLQTQTVSQPTMARPISATDNAQLADALSALQALGFKEKEVAKVGQQLQTTDENLTTDQYLSQGLKLLTK